MSQYASRDWNLYHPKRIGPNAKKPAQEWDVIWEGTGPIGPGETHAFHTPPRNAYGEYWRNPGQPVTFVVHAYRPFPDGSEVTTGDYGTTDPVDTYTDQDGVARGVLLSSETAGNLEYEIEVKMTVVPV